MPDWNQMYMYTLSCDFNAAWLNLIKYVHVIFMLVFHFILHIRKWQNVIQVLFLDLNAICFSVKLSNSTAFLSVEFIKKKKRTLVEYLYSLVKSRFQMNEINDFRKCFSTRFYVRWIQWAIHNCPRTRPI